MENQQLKLNDLITSTSDNKVLNIYAMGEINENVSREIIETLLDAKWEEDKINTLNFFICSCGGNLGDCFAIIDMLNIIKQTKKVKIITHGLGEVISAGFFLFLIGDSRILHPSCRVFVHEHITTGIEGQTFGERVKQDKTEEKMVYTLYIDYIAKQLNMTDKKAKSLVKKNAWLNNEQIDEFSIVTKDIINE